MGSNKNLTATSPALLLDTPIMFLASYLSRYRTASFEHVTFPYKRKIYNLIKKVYNFHNFKMIKSRFNARHSLLSTNLDCFDFYSISLF